MQAIRVHECGGPEVMRLEEIPDLTPGPREVVVRVKAAGVNPVDTYIRTGAYATPPLPFTPGFDAAGEVEALGPEVTRVAAGQRVYVAGSLSGAYARQVLCEETQVHPLPLRASFAQGAALGIPCGIAYRALFQRAKALAGETVLIHGASGGVGTAAVQLARAAGLRVIGTGGTPRGRELAANQGAHHVLDHHSPAYPDEILKLTGGQGVDVIIELLANVNLAKDLKLLAPGGRVVVIGCRGSVEIDPRDAMSREAAILGALIFLATPKEYAAIHAGLTAALDNGTLRPVIGQELPLKDAPRAHQKVMEPGA
ncbi:MAG: NADPH:quinone reductase, partial [Syntrophales bacterium]|nr:NADPH:quinone reductase [Syntrophales bacterium]